MRPVGRNGLEQRDEIRWPDDRHAGGIDVRSEGHTGERRIAAIRAPHDPDPFRIDDALIDPLQVVHGEASGRWRVWSITRSGEIAFSKVRTFVHRDLGCTAMASGADAADGRKRLDRPPQTLAVR